MSAPSVLLVEDEPEIRRFVRTTLQAQGWNVHESETMKQGLIDAGTTRPDIVILDLGLPDGDGRDFIRGVREWSGMPIIVLSARTGEADKVGALDAGADDYLTKPFGVAELLARVRAALRRRGTPPAQGKGLFRFGNVEVDLESRVVRNKGEVVRLTPVEYRLLQLLIANAGKVLTHRLILREVWGPSHVDHHHYARVYMGHLRQKLEEDPARPRHLLTETGVGYRLIAEDETSV